MEEVEQGFTRLQKCENVWKYEVIHKDKQLKNITVLFRGTPDHILSRLIYGVLLVNDKVISTLTNVDEDDPRVMAFDIEVPNPKGLDLQVVLSFKPHDYDEKMIRILADVCDAEDRPVKTAYGSIDKCEVKGDLWDQNWAPKKFDLDDEIEIFTETAAKRIKLDFETRQVEMVLGIHRATLANRLDELVAWKAHRKAIDDRLAEL
jgi:hypothetical protein